MIEQAAVLAAAGALLLLTVWAALRERARLRPLRPTLLALAALVLGGLALRLVTAPAFVHVNFHGPSLMAEILAFPRAASFRAEYGQGSFALLGLAARLAGRRAEVVLAANALASSLTAVPAAIVAARWAGRRRAGIYAAAAWSASPLLARLGHSEDAHDLALLFALSALAWAELASPRRRTAFVASVLAAALAGWTRQTLYPMLPLIGLALWARWREAGGGRAAPLVWLLLVGAAVSPAVARMATARDNDPLRAAYHLLARDPGLLARVAWAHPWLSPRAVGLAVPLLGSLGVAWLIARSRRRLAVAVGGCVLVLATLPFSFPSPGVAWSFRSPLWALGVVAVGVASARLRWPRWTALPTVLVASLAAAATAELATPEPSFAEYVFLRDAAPTLPPGTILLTPSLREPAPSHQLVETLAPSLGLRTATLDAPAAGGPRLLLDGLACHARSLRELLGDEEKLLAAALDPADHFGLDRIVPPTAPRPECAAALAHARVVRVGPTVATPPDPPMAIYDAPSLTLRIVEP